MGIQLKIGERIILKSDFIKKIVANDDISSKTFVISAMTDVAIGLKNLRTGKSYTVRVEDVVSNAEIFEPPKTISTKMRAVINVTPPQELPVPQPTTPVTLAPDPVDVVQPAVAPTDPSKPDDVFKELYG